VGVWKEAIGGLVPLKNKSKFAAQREEKKNDALALKTILSGISSSIKEIMVQCTSTKDIWLKLEEIYQRKKDDTKYNSIKNNEGKESPKTPNCNISKCDDVEYLSTSEEENIEIVCVELDDSYPMEEVEEELPELKRKVEWGLFEHNYDHCYIEYNYIYENTKRFLKKNQRHILKLKEMLKEQEESKRTQLEEKEEEIKRLKNEIEENKKLDDE
jgi:hypothetical protein